MEIAEEEAEAVAAIREPIKAEFEKAVAEGAATAAAAAIRERGRMVLSGSGACTKGVMICTLCMYQVDDAPLTMDDDGIQKVS